MKAQPEDRLTADTRRPGPFRNLAIVVVLVAAAAAAWYFIGGGKPEPAVTPPVATAPEKIPAAPLEPNLPPAPDIPELPPSKTTPLQPEKPPLTLQGSDAVLRDELAHAGSSALLTDALVPDNLVERGAAIVDVLSRGRIDHNVIPAARPEEKFSVLQSEGQLYVNPDSYARFDDYARSIGELDTGVLVAGFHLARPLLEQAYAGLGYDAAHFDNAVIHALDLVLATPRLDEPLRVVPKGGIYQFADPRVERLAPVQKLLLRMGPENAAKVRAQAQALRDALLTVPVSQPMSE